MIDWHQTGQIKPTASLPIWAHQLFISSVSDVFVPAAADSGRRDGSDLQRSSIGQIRVDTQDHDTFHPVQLHQRDDRHVQSRQLHEQTQSCTSSKRHQETRRLERRQELIYSTIIFIYWPLQIFNSGQNDIFESVLLTYWMLCSIDIYKCNIYVPVISIYCKLGFLICTIQKISADAYIYEIV